MQAKMGLYGIHQTTNQAEIEVERKIFNATLQSKDYTKQSGFMSVAEFKENNSARAENMS